MEVSVYLPRKLKRKEKRLLKALSKVGYSYANAADSYLCTKVLQPYGLVNVRLQGGLATVDITSEGRHVLAGHWHVKV